MQKHQLDMWLHGEHKDSYQTPKVYVIGCSDISEYLLAVEYKHKLEPVKQDGEPLHFGFLRSSGKRSCSGWAFEKAYLRLHNAYDEFGNEPSQSYCDIELALKPH